MKGIMTYLKIALVVVSLFCAQQILAASTTITDDSIVSSVQSKLSGSQLTNALPLTVTSNSGVVTLTGIVSNNTQAAKAVELAEATPGVTDVDTSQLTINGNQQPTSDSIITAKVKGALIREHALGSSSLKGITVQTTDGVVSLIGTASSQAQIDSATQIAKTVSGVKSVNTKLTVK
jgi:hyperosmotically inducible protein